MTPDELKNRTKKFAVDIIKLTQKLPENRIGWIIENQLVKALRILRGSMNCSQQKLLPKQRVVLTEA